MPASELIASAIDTDWRATLSWPRPRWLRIDSAIDEDGLKAALTVASILRWRAAGWAGPVAGTLGRSSGRVPAGTGRDCSTSGLGRVADIVTGLPTVVSVCRPNTEVWLLTKFLSAAVFALPTSFLTLPVNLARPDLPDFWGAAGSAGEAPPAVSPACNSGASARKSLMLRCTRVASLVPEAEGPVTTGREAD